ncbi:MAG: hypothetical protein HC890_08835 [Chloroflexaceae bacterium]|nr:hypothetical protein [Chloroflexaceae bacterium]
MNHLRLYSHLFWVLCPLWSAGSCLFFLSPSYGQTPEQSPLESGPPATFTPLIPPPVPAQPPGISDPPDNSFSLYRLNVGDAIAGVVEGFPEFNFRSPVDSQGNIIVPILGRVAAAGLTLEELEAKVSFELGRRFLQEGPPVIVRVEGRARYRSP